MKWTEPKPPAEGVSRYEHLTCDTPLGKAIIEWKGWKKHDSYSLTIGDEHVGNAEGLEAAKNLAKWFIRKNHKESDGLIGESAPNSPDLTKNKVIYTGHIPQCPNCKKPTTRTSGCTSVTDVYFPPIYDENGVNTNPDRNTRSTDYKCLECGSSYLVSGNDADGYFYR